MTSVDGHPLSHNMDFGYDTNRTKGSDSFGMEEIFVRVDVFK
jgi:hypothetical protein